MRFNKQKRLSVAFVLIVSIFVSIFVIMPTSTAATTLIDTLEYNTVKAGEPSTVRLGESEYYVALYVEDTTNYGYYSTFQVLNVDGTIGASTIADGAFDTGGQFTKMSAIYVTTNTVLVVARNSSAAGKVKTLFFDESDGTFIEHGDNATHGLASSGSVNQNKLCNLTVDNTGDGSLFVWGYKIDEASDNASVSIVHVKYEDGGVNINDTIEVDSAPPTTIGQVLGIDSDTFVYMYSDENGDGTLITYNVSTETGAITETPSDTYVYDTTASGYTDIVHVSGTVYALVYAGVDTDGFIQTINIYDNGTIGDANLSWWEFETDYCEGPDLLKDSGTTYLISFRNYSGATSHGKLSTLLIANDGTINQSLEGNITIDETRFTAQSMIEVANDYYLVSYEGADSDGFAKSYQIEGGVEEVPNSVPTFSFEEPGNNTEIPTTTTTINVTIADNDATDTLNWTIESDIGSDSGAREASNTSVNATITGNLTGGESYTWYVNVTDGTDWSNATYNFDATLNHVPVLSFENPTNGTSNVPVGTTLVNVTITDIDGDTLNWTIQSDIGSDSGARDVNGSFNATITGNITYGIVYVWYVNVSDGTNWTNESFTFTTISNTLSTISSESPTNNSIGVTISSTTLSATINDLDGDTMSWTIESDIGSNSGSSGNGSVSTSITGNLTYNTVYTWYLNVSDGTGYTRSIYSFTSEGNFDDSVYTYNMSLEITNTSDGEQTNYPMELHINYSGDDSQAGYIELNNHSKTDFSDIRFTDWSNNELSYWIQEKVSSSNATVWVEINTINSTGTTDITIHYGNSEATTSSNESLVFVNATTFNQFELKKDCFASDYISVNEYNEIYLWWPSNRSFYRSDDYGDNWIYLGVSTITSGDGEYIAVSCIPGTHDVLLTGADSGGDLYWQIWNATTGFESENVESGKGGSDSTVACLNETTWFYLGTDNSGTDLDGYVTYDEGANWYQTVPCSSFESHVTHTEDMGSIILNNGSIAVQWEGEDTDSNDYTVAPDSIEGAFGEFDPANNTIIWHSRMDITGGTIDDVEGGSYLQNDNGTLWAIYVTNRDNEFQGNGKDLSYTWKIAAQEYLGDGLGWGPRRYIRNEYGYGGSGGHQWNFMDNETYLIHSESIAGYHTSPEQGFVVHHITSATPFQENLSLESEVDCIQGMSRVIENEDSRKCLHITGAQGTRKTINYWLDAISAFNASTNFNDYAFDTAVYTKNPDSELSLVLRLVDNNSYYAWQIDSNSISTVYEVTDGTWTALDAVAFSEGWVSSVWYNLSARIETDGTDYHFMIYINDTLYNNFTDSNQTYSNGGRVGVRDGNTLDVNYPVYADDWVLRKWSYPEPTWGAPGSEQNATITLAFQMNATSPITTTTARLIGYISNDGGSEVSRKLQWRSHNDSYGGTYSGETSWAHGYTTGDETTYLIEDLEQTTLYYARMQANNSEEGVSNSDEISFLTKCTAISGQLSAAFYDNNTNTIRIWVAGNADGNTTVVRYKVGSSVSDETDGTEIFNSSVDNDALILNISYDDLPYDQELYFKAWNYVEWDDLNYYEGDIEFKLRLPVEHQNRVLTDAITNITTTTATLNGNLSEDGGQDNLINFEYSTDETYTTNTTNLTATSERLYSSDIAGLTPGQIYYVRARANNSNVTNRATDSYYRYLYYGWNLLYLPEYVHAYNSTIRVDPTSGNYVFGPNASKITIVWYYNETTTSWQSWANNETAEELEVDMDYHKDLIVFSDYNFSFEIPIDKVAFVARPEGPTNFVADEYELNQINLTWTKGTGANNTVVVRKEDSYPTSTTDGSIVYNGTGTSYNDAGLGAGAWYYKAYSYSEWIYDSTWYQFSTATDEDGGNITNSNPFITDLIPFNNSNTELYNLSIVTFTLCDNETTFNWTVEGDFLTTNSSTSSANGTFYATIPSELSGNTEYNWYINVTDGEMWTNETFTFRVNITPEVSSLSPANTETGTELDIGFISFDISDLEGETMNYSVTTTPNIGSGSGNDKTNGTYTVPISSLSYLTTYYWTLKVTDGITWNNDTYSFTTKSSSTNAPNAPTNPSPSDGATDRSVDLGTLSCSASDPDLDVMNVTFYWNNGTLIGYDYPVSSGTLAEVSVGTLEFNTTYNWYAIANDTEDETQSSVWSFTTSESVTSIDVDPTSYDFEENEYNSIVTSSTATITNDGDYRIDTINVKISNFEDNNQYNSWTPATETAFDEFTLKYYNTTTTSWTTLTTSYQTVDGDLPVDDTTTFKLRFYMPELSTFTGTMYGTLYIQYVGEITREYEFDVQISTPGSGADDNLTMLDLTTNDFFKGGVISSDKYYFSPPGNMTENTTIKIPSTYTGKWLWFLTKEYSITSTKVYGITTAWEFVDVPKTGKPAEFRLNIDDVQAYNGYVIVTNPGYFQDSVWWFNRLNSARDMYIQGESL